MKDRGADLACCLFQRGVGADRGARFELFRAVGRERRAVEHDAANQPDGIDGHLTIGSGREVIGLDGRGHERIGAGDVDIATALRP